MTDAQREELKRLLLEYHCTPVDVARVQTRRYEINAYVDSLIAAEREAAAKTCESEADNWTTREQQRVCRSNAEAIREKHSNPLAPKQRGLDDRTVPRSESGPG